MTLILWWYSVLAKFYKPEHSYWNELKKYGYTIERHHVYNAFFIASPDGYRCGALHKYLDDLMATLDDFARQELERIKASDGI